jgi:hypothetical protein
MAAIGAEGEIARFHGNGETRGNGLLAEREMARAFHQILQEEVVGPLFGLTQFHLDAV